MGNGADRVAKFGSQKTILVTDFSRQNYPKKQVEHIRIRPGHPPLPAA
ncbi:MAG: hypothetical protein HY862_21570 [Chloroflexi bacterium]|nr:hypothetical protein [Chloroflexota bacterium]